MSLNTRYQTATIMMAVDRFTLLLHAKPMPSRTIVQMLITSSDDDMPRQTYSWSPAQVIRDVRSHGIVDVKALQVNPGEHRDGPEDRANDPGKTAYMTMA